MLTNKKLSFVAGVFMLLGSQAFANPLEDGVATCGVPVCNVDETIDALSQVDENKRYNYANKMLAKYSDTEDLKILENLLLTSKRIKDLSISTTDADWVVRESASLSNAMIIGLAKHSAINAFNLTGYYKQISSDLKRYEIIEFWTKKVDSIEDSSELNELVKFAKNAKAHSLALGDEAWIPRAAFALAGKITVKLTQLDPAHEGVFSVNAVISGETRGILPFDKIAVLDSSSEENLVVIFYNSEFKRASFIFNGAVISGNTITSTAVSNSQTSKEFSLEIDRVSGSVSGKLTTTDSSIVFSGAQSFSTREVFAGVVPVELKEEDAIGQYEGVVGNIPVTLTVKSFLPGVYSATLRSANGVIKKDYKGKFYPKNGVLTLTHKSNLKLIISLREVNGKTSWNGFSYSIKRPTAIKASFVKK